MSERMGEAGVLPYVATLRRLLQQRDAARAGERCELCHALLADEHGHLVDTRTRRLLCACQICGALGGRYRAVPTRYVRLPGVTVSVEQWDALAIPVGLAFFFFNSDLDRIVACYPGPAGAAESLLPLDAWPGLVERNPSIDALVPDVEALLVRRVGDEYTAFIVPISACYELVGRIRGAWTGFGGGDAGRRAIEEFFATVLDKAADASESGTSGSFHNVQEGT
jgi:hypothetical protein